MVYQCPPSGGASRYSRSLLVGVGREFLCTGKLINGLLSWYRFGRRSPVYAILYELLGEQVTEQPGQGRVVVPGRDPGRCYHWPREPERHNGITIGRFVSHGIHLLASILPAVLQLVNPLDALRVVMLIESAAADVPRGLDEKRRFAQFRYVRCGGPLFGGHAVNCARLFPFRLLPLRAAALLLSWRFRGSFGRPRRAGRLRSVSPALLAAAGR